MSQPSIPRPVIPQPAIRGAGAPTTPLQEEARESRLRIARHLAELHCLHLALAQDTRELKRFSTAGQARIEAEIAA